MARKKSAKAVPEKKDGGNKAASALSRLRRSTRRKPVPPIEERKRESSRPAQAISGSTRLRRSTRQNPALPVEEKEKGLESPTQDISGSNKLRRSTRQNPALPIEEKKELTSQTQATSGSSRLRRSTRRNEAPPIENKERELKLPTQALSGSSRLRRSTRRNLSPLNEEKEKTLKPSTEVAGPSRAKKKSKQDFAKNVASKKKTKEPTRSSPEKPQSPEIYLAREMGVDVPVPSSNELEVDEEGFLSVRGNPTKWHIIQINREWARRIWERIPEHRRQVVHDAAVNSQYGSAYAKQISGSTVWPPPPESPGIISPRTAESSKKQQEMANWRPPRAEDSEEDSEDYDGPEIEQSLIDLQMQEELDKEMDCRLLSEEMLSPDRLLSPYRAGGTSTTRDPESGSKATPKANITDQILDLELDSPTRWLIERITRGDHFSQHDIEAGIATFKQGIAYTGKNTPSPPQINIQSHRDLVEPAVITPPQMPRINIQRHQNLVEPAATTPSQPPQISIQRHQNPVEPAATTSPIIRKTTKPVEPAVTTPPQMPRINIQRHQNLVEPAATTPSQPPQIKIQRHQNLVEPAATTSPTTHKTIKRRRPAKICPEPLAKKQKTETPTGNAYFSTNKRMGYSIVGTSFPDDFHYFIKEMAEKHGLTGFVYDVKRVRYDGRPINVLYAEAQGNLQQSSDFFLDIFSNGSDEDVKWPPGAVVELIDTEGRVDHTVEFVPGETRFVVREWPGFVRPGLSGMRSMRIEELLVF
jgi:hypothetical protein